MESLRLTAILLLACGLCYCDEKKDNANELEHEQEHNELARQWPVFGYPQFPSFPALFPSVGFPQFQFPAHPPPPFKREKLTATKTVLFETTERVTHHPICITAYGHKPSCLQEQQRDILNELEEDVEDQRSQILPNAVPAIPTSETRILGEIADSSNAIESAESPVIEAQEIEKSRPGRYLTPHPIPFIPNDYQIRNEPAKHEYKKIVEGVLKAPYVITKTLWVTKVENVIDRHTHC